MAYLIIGWLLGVILTLAAAMDSRDSRWAARFVLLCPVWPVLALMFGARGIKKLWKMAEWRKFPL